MSGKVVAYLDTNIFLNIIYKEPRFQQHSAGLLQQIQSGGILGLTSAVTLLEIILDMQSSGLDNDTIDAAISAVEDIRYLSIISLDAEISKRAAKLVLDDKLTIHDAYHLGSALEHHAIYFVTRDETLAKKATNYITPARPEELTRKLI